MHPQINSNLPPDKNCMSTFNKKIMQPFRVLANIPDSSKTKYDKFYC